MVRIPFRMGARPAIRNAGSLAAKAFGVESALGRFFHSSPETAMFTTVDENARFIAENLLRRDFAQRKNLAGEASKQGIELDYDITKDTLLGSLAESTDELYYKTYRPRMSQSTVPDPASQQTIAKIVDELGQNGINGRGWLNSNKPYLSRTEFLSEAAKTMRRFSEGNKAPHPIPEVNKVAREYKEKIFEPFLKRQVKDGFISENVAKDKEFAEGYLSQIFNIQAINRNPQKFIDSVTRAFERSKVKFLASGKERIKVAQEKLSKATTPEAKKKAQESLDGLLEKQKGLEKESIARGWALAYYDDLTLGSHYGMSPSDYVPKELHQEVRKNSRFQLKRKLLIPKDMLEEFEPFLENDLDRISYLYIRANLPRMLLKERFGSVDLEDWIGKSIKSFDDKILATEDPRDRAMLAVEKMRMAGNSGYIKAVRDRFLGIYKLPDNPYGTLSRVSNGFLRLNLVRALGGVTISSLPDMARHIARFGATNTFKVMGNAINNSEYAKLAAKDLKSTVGIYELVLQNRLFERAEIDRGYGGASPFERGLNKLSDKFGTITFISHWNQVQKQFAAMSASSMIIDDARIFVKSGKITEANLKRFAEGGFDKTHLKRLADQFNQFGTDHNGVLIAQSASWKDKEIAEMFNRFVRREVELTIVTPGIGSRPLWTSTRVGKLISQFKAFGATSVNSVLLSGLQQRDMRVLNGMMLSIFMGAAVYQMKERLRGREPSADPNVLLAEGIDRSGVLGWITDVSNMVEKASRGTIGINVLLGGPGASRVKTFDMFAALGGPTSGTVADLTKVFGAGVTGDFSESDVRSLRRLHPYHQLFYLRWMFNAMEEGYKKALVGES